MGLTTVLRNKIAALDLVMIQYRAATERTEAALEGMYRARAALDEATEVTNRGYRRSRRWMVFAAVWNALGTLWWLAHLFGLVAW